MGQEIAAQARRLVVYQRDAPQHVLHQRTVRLDGLDELVGHGARGRDRTYGGQAQQQERYGLACKEMSAPAVRQCCHRHPLNLLPAQSSNNQVGSIMALPPRLMRATNI